MAAVVTRLMCHLKLNRLSWLSCQMAPIQPLRALATHMFVIRAIATASSKHSPMTATAAGKGEYKLGSGLEITMASDLIAVEVASSSVLNKGGDSYY
mmetsp:Transcript_2154/g.3883  ORF Transcript_2154/g.3883 Transcript_2154/m.3883 type:complete len:97 (-) Transcript_2154:247-537(-)